MAHWDLRVTTKAELLVAMEQDWAALNTALDRLTPAQMTTAQDAQGWTVKDHLAHLYSWERSALFFLQGRARHAGLGVDEQLYLNGDEDEINAAIVRQHKDTPLAEVQAELQNIHEQLVAAVQPLRDADLQKPYRHYLPDEPGEGDGPPALNVVYGNSAHHFAEHLPWMEALGTGGR